MGRNRHTFSRASFLRPTNLRVADWAVPSGGLPREHNARVPAVSEEVCGVEADGGLVAGKAGHEAVRGRRLPRIDDVVEVIARTDDAADIEEGIAAEDAQPAGDLEAGGDVELGHDDEVVLAELAAVAGD